MSALRMIYLGLAIAGAVLPMRHFAAWFAENGFGIAGLIAAWNVNRAAQGLVWDLALAGVALTVWIVAETWVRKNWTALIAIPATVLIGVGCGLPLYLFLRTRKIS